MRLNKIIRKKIVETVDRKEKSAIKQKLFERKVEFILGKDLNEDKIKSLSKDDQIIKFIKIAEAYRYYYDDEVLNEGLWDLIKSLFGPRLFSGAAETFAETMLDTMLSKIGLKGTLKNTIVSFIATDPRRLMAAMSSCRELTKLIAESIIEGIVMTWEDKSMITNNPIFGGIRNILGDAIKETSVVSGVENKIADTICSLFGSYQDKASNLVDKLASK